MLSYENNIKRDYTIEDLEELLDSLPYEIWIKDEEGKHRYANRFCAERMGCTKEEIIGKTDYDLRPSNIAEEYIKSDQQVIESNQSMFIDKKVQISNKDKWYEVYKMPLNNSKDNRLVAGIAKEIGIDKALQNAIVQSSLSVIDNSEETCSKTHDFKILYELKSKLKAKSIAMYLCDRDKDTMNLYLNTNNIESVFPKEYILKDEIKESLNNSRIIKRRISETNIKYIYAIKLKDRLLGTIEVYYDNEIYKYMNKDMIRYTCFIFSIIIDNRNLSTDLKTELEIRKDTQKKLEMIIDTAIDVYALGERNGDEFLWIETSKNCRKLLGWECADLNERSPIDFIHASDKHKMQKVIEDKNVKEQKNFVCRVYCKDGIYKTIDFNWSYIFDNTFIITAKDISEHIELMQDKHKLKQEVELESLKTEFFANLSHEFKTPLNIILSTVQVILSYMLQNKHYLDYEKMNRYINSIKQNSYRLLKLANNMIDITKIDGGFYEIELDNYNIVEVVENIIQSVAGYMENNKRRIIFDTCEEEIITACDPDQIERIILNLLSNSLKFTSINGNIYVDMNINKKCNTVIIKVRNDGPALCQHDAERIFNRFTQSENLLTRSIEGSGIGLALVKSLVELHKGKVYANTMMKKGTEFCIELPIRKIMNCKSSHVWEKNINSKVEKYSIEFSDIYTLN